MLEHGNRPRNGVRRGLVWAGVLAVLNASAALGQSPPSDRESAAPRPFSRQKEEKPCPDIEGAA